MRGVEYAKRIGFGGIGFAKPRRRLSGVGFARWARWGSERRSRTLWVVKVAGRLFGRGYWRVEVLSANRAS
jgi:hypothetical protein